MKHLVLASFNTRSIYGRETWITELIKKHHFAVMGIQDPKLRMNNMPMGLFRTEDPTPGLRGLITVIHPAWAHLIAIPAIDNEDCSYIQWVEVQCLPDPVYVANLYLPNHRDASWKSRANDLVQTLITNISDLGDNARVVVMGDLNADLESGKGDNAVLIKRLLAQTHLARVRRSDPQAFTRKEGKHQSHIDDFLATPNIRAHLVGSIQYVRNAGQIPPVVIDSEVGGEAVSTHDRKNPDHVPIFVKFNIQRVPRTRHKAVHTRWDTRELCEGNTGNYQLSLTMLTERWLAWQYNLLHECSLQRFTPTCDIATIMYEGLIYILNQTAFTTLGTTTVFARSSHIDYTDPAALSRESATDMWALIKKRLKSRSDQSQVAPPLDELERKERCAFSRQPFTTDRAVQKFVTRKLQQIDQARAPRRTQDERQTNIDNLTGLAILQCDKLDSKVAEGFDAIPNIFIKASPHCFKKAISTFVEDCKYFCISPLHMLLGLQSYIPKKATIVTSTDALGVTTSIKIPRWRGLRRASNLGKLLEKLFAHPILPLDKSRCTLICRENLAGAKGLSSEMAAWVIGILIQIRGKLPGYYVITDVEGAYDNVWRDALWAKLAAKHGNVYHVKMLSVMYRKMQSRIRMGDYTSEIIEAMLGLAQGGSNSGKLFAAFLSDLPDDLLKQISEPMDIFGVDHLPDFHGRCAYSTSDGSRRNCCTGSAPQV